MAKDYLVPRKVLTRAEIFPGFGGLEIAAVAGGAAFGYVLQLIPGLFGLPVAPTLFARFVLFTLPTAGAYMLVRPTVSGDSLLNLFRAWWHWRQGIKTYYYERRGS